MQFLPLFMLASVVLASPHRLRDDQAVVRTWEAAGKTDSRGPCPLLNTLANHGYLPHDGRNITAKNLGQAIHDALSFDITAGEDQANLQLAILGKSVVDLEDFNVPDLVEHRASLTRNDSSSGNSLTLDPSRLQAMLADSTSDSLDINSLVKSLVRVEALSETLTAAHIQQSAAEVALLLVTMSTVELPASGTDFSSITVPKDRAEAWLANERLPVEFGWQPAPRQYKLADLTPMIRAILTMRAAAMA